MSFVVEVAHRMTIRQGLAGRRPVLKPGEGVDITITAGVAFEDDQLDERGRFFDTDAAAERLERACAVLSGGPWTELFDFRPTFELVARHLFRQLAGEIPQLAYVELRDESFGSRTRYLPTG
jgi:hypothetical protein